MRESMDTLQRTPAIDRALDIVDSMHLEYEKPTNLYLQGPSGSGKSRLIRTLGNESGENDDKESLFACSGGDLLIALHLETSDPFLERIGIVHILLVDDIDCVFSHEKGDMLVSLLLQQRETHALHTLFSSRKSPEELEAIESKESLNRFELVELTLLDESEQKKCVSCMIEEYSSGSSPIVDEEAIASIVEITQHDLTEAEMAVRYLLTTEGICDEGHITSQLAKELLKK